MDGNRIKIESYGEIQKSAIGHNFRHVMLRDINNGKSIDYVVFEKYLMWDDITNNETEKTYYPGKIMEIKLTNDLIKVVNLNNQPIHFQENEIMVIVVWVWDEWKQNPESVRIQFSLKEQLWKLKGYNKKSKDDQRSENTNDYDTDYGHKSSYNSPFYNDNLDMDQQSAEFWDDIG